MPFWLGRRSRQLRLWVSVSLPGLGIQAQPLAEDFAGPVDLPRLQGLENRPPAGNIDDGLVHVGIVKTAQLQEDPVHPVRVVQMRLGFPEQLDREVVPPPELEVPAKLRLLGRVERRVLRQR